MITRRLLLSVMPVAPFLAAKDPAYQTSIERWREEREAKLKASDGWLTVAGLFWLKPGKNTIGGPGSQVVLPRVQGPLGSFEVSDSGVKFVPQPGASSLTLNGKPPEERRLKTDKDGEPDQFRTGKLTFFVIKRGPRLGIRLRDQESEFLREFTHLNWYAIQPEYRITAKWEPYAEKRRVEIQTVIGEPDVMWSPGKASFQIQGKPVTLEAVDDEGKLWFIFRDGTSGKTTYAGGRFLYSELPVNGQVTLDFNQAYNPPCVFTPFATCPLPTPQNRLTVAIPAGEQRYGKH